VRLFITIVLDGVGIGEQPDADQYEDAGSDTLGHISERTGVKLPNLERMGLGCIRPLTSVGAVEEPLASYGRMTEISPGKDSTTGHWELSGILLDRPFPLYPEGFPDGVVESFCMETGCSGLLGNRAASGTQIIAELGDRHVESGHPIVYTSADSVFQVAAHTDVIPLEDQYEICRLTRERVCVGEHGVGRVIARPFHGESGSYERISAARKDFSIRPVAATVQEALQTAGVTTVSIGKIKDLFSGVGFDEAYKTRSNQQGVRTLLARAREAVHDDRPTFIWINLVDFDQEYGHRNDVAGFASALEAFDRSLPSLIALLPEGARLTITADHGNDPTTPNTDHSREYVPLLYYGAGKGLNLGTRASFRDHAATAANYFGASFACEGVPFEDFV